MADTNQEVNNPRGYAFVTFHRVFRSWRSYDWFAARKRHGLVPSHSDMLAEAMRMWDRLSVSIDTTDMDQVRGITKQIHVEMRRSFYATGYGIIGRKRGEGASYPINEPLTEGLARKAGEGNGAVAELIELDASLRPLLTEQQRRVWDVMVRDVTASPADVAAALGMSNQNASAYQQKIYRHARNLKEGLRKC